MHRVVAALASILEGERLVKKLLLSVFLLLLVSISGTAFSESWILFVNLGNPPINGNPNEMVFNLNNNVLSLNTPNIITVGGSSSMSYSLLFSGQWAVCGQVDNAGQLIQDPYASFVVDGDGSGHIAWSTTTPYGYTTNLLLGADFTGNGASSYAGSWYGMGVDPVAGTLVLQQQQTTYRTNVLYSDMGYHVFQIAKNPQVVPEPSGLIGMILVGSAAFGAYKRSRRIAG
jgi:hypothetical protein